MFRRLQDHPRNGPKARSMPTEMNLKDLVPARPALRHKARRRRSRVTVQVRSV